MKSQLVVFLAVISVGIVSCQQKEISKSDLKDQKDKVSYSIGLDIGKNLKKQSIEIDPNILMQGLKDGLTDSISLMTDQEIQETMMAFQQQMMEKHNAKQQALSGKNKTEGEKFLAENKNKEGVVTLPSGLQYKVLKSGSGKSPKESDQVTTHYTGKLLDGTVFDSSVKREAPATFPVKGVIPGWTEALQLMKEGDKWELYIPSNLAYGEHGAGEMIGPNAALIFEVELIKVESK